MKVKGDFMQISQSKIEYLLARIEIICLIVMLICMFISVLLEGIANEGIYLIYTANIAFFIAFICICTEGVMDLWQNIKTYKNRKKALLFTVKNSFVLFFFKNLSSIVGEFVNETGKLLKSDKREEKIQGYVACIVMLISISFFVLSCLIFVR